MSDPIFETGLNEPPKIRSSKFSATGESVIDESTFNAIEIDRLFDSVNHSETVIGQATLYKSLIRPLSDIEAITEKQTALNELTHKPDLRKKIESLVANASHRENDFFTLLSGTFIGMLGNTHHEHEHEGYGYEPYRKGTQFMLDIVDDARTIESPDSQYLKTVFARIEAFSETKPYLLMRGPAYKTERGMLTKAEKQPLTPGFIFTPALFKPLLVITLLAAIMMLYHLAPLSPGISPSVLPTLLFFCLPLSLVYIPAVGTFDRDSCIYPLRDIYKQSHEVEQALESMGKLDELLSFYRFGQSFKPEAILAKIHVGDQHNMHLRRVKSPILAKEDHSYVANSIDLDKDRLTFITGPNSGGKTAVCKTIAQVQLLSQIGCPVPAESVDASVADAIFYQVPEYSKLDAGEGRFATELRRTKDIFLASSAASLVILDELSEGTTYEEKLETSENILDGFRRKNNTTVLITHNHELVEGFLAKKFGQALQVEFKDDDPTYRLINGVSHVSHADRVAENIGFSKKDIDKYLDDET